MSASEAFAEFASRLSDNGGFTYDHRVAEGYWVSEGYALSIDPDRTKVVDEFNPETVGNFYVDNWDRLQLDGKMFGAWLDTETGKTHLDVVTIFTDREEAIKYGRFYGEIAIYDLTAGEEIRLSYKVGDSDPYPWEWDGPENWADPGCEASSRFVCTMLENHNSPHVAGDGQTILEVWSK